MVDTTARLRKQRQRESAKKWLERNARGLTPDALVTALQKKKCKLIWLVDEEKKK